MKRLLIPVLCLLLLAACNSKPANVNKIGVVDIISISDNGVTYHDTVPAPHGIITFTSVEDTTTEENSTGRFAPAGHKNLNDITDSFFYNCGILKGSKHSAFTLIYHNPASNLPVSFAIINAIGPLNGTGIYKSKAGDTVGESDKSGKKTTKSQNFIAFAKDDQKYTVDSVLVNITKADGDKLQGSFQLWITGTTGPRSVTGTMNCNVESMEKYAAR